VACLSPRQGDDPGEEQITALGQGIESELTQVDAVPLGRLIELVAAQDLRALAAEDELALRERSAGDDASARRL
jgi:hypothetical protein